MYARVRKCFIFEYSFRFALISSALVAHPTFKCHLKKRQRDDGGALNARPLIIIFERTNIQFLDFWAHVACATLAVGAWCTHAFIVTVSLLQILILILLLASLNITSTWPTIASDPLRTNIITCKSIKYLFRL